MMLMSSSSGRFVTAPRCSLRRRPEMLLSRYTAALSRFYRINGHLQIIRAAKGSMRNVPVAGSERFSKLSSVIATLLHVGMINIVSDNEELRLASYELLCAVCTYLDFEGRPIVPTKGVRDSIRRLW